MLRFAVTLTSLVLLVQDVLRADEPVWLTGKDLERSRMLAMSADWLEAPLRSQLVKLSRNRQIAIFIDRRVDPNKKATYSAQDVTWEQLVWSLAEKYEIGVCRLDDLYYFGPLETCRSLPVLYQSLRKEITTNRKNHQVDWRSKTRPCWPRLSQPAELLDQLAREKEFTVSGAEAIYFDIWPEHDLPAVSLLQQTLLLAVGFDRWIEISSDGRQIALVPFPAVDHGQLTIRGVDDAKRLILDLRDEFASCNLKSLGRSIVASGSTVEIAKLQQRLVNLQTADVGDASRHRFSMVDTTAKRGVILASVARTLELELSYTPETSEALQQLIKVNLQDVTARQILDQVLEGTNLKYQITGQQLSISVR